MSNKNKRNQQQNNAVDNSIAEITEIVDLPVIEPHTEVNENPSTEAPELTPEITETPEVETPEDKEPQPEETQPEPTPEETTSTEIPETEVPEDTVELKSWAEIRACLASEISYEEKIAILEKTKFEGVNVVMAILRDYVNAAGFIPGKTTVDSKLIAKYNTKLYTLIIGILREKDEAAFVVKFTIINMVFANNENNAFKETMLCRFSDLMSLDKDRLSTYHKLCVLLSSLCNVETREKNAKSLCGINTQFSAFTPEDIVRLRTFYKF